MAVTFRKPKVRVDPHTECWEWLAYKNQDGYGCLNRGGRVLGAHRWMYEQALGPIPADHEVDHKCQVRHCVNPSHLEAVTKTENIRRGAVTRLDQSMVDEIRDSSETKTALAAKFGVSRKTIHDVVGLRTWKEVV